MHRSVTLSQYVKKRNGVALGASHSMRNMLARSLGAHSFAVFWHHWNPIWGYYLARYVMRPLSACLPLSVASLLTFMVSGLLHDLAVTLVKWQLVVFFTPWFALMGGVAIGAGSAGITYRQFSWPVRASINALIVVATFYVARLSMGGSI